MKNDSILKSRGADSLIGKLHAVLTEYCEGEGVEMEFAMRDALTDMRHICDIHELNLGDIDGRAHQGYLSEVAYESGERTPEALA